MGKLTIRNLLAIITGTAIAFSLVFAPFTPSVSLSEFGLIPAEYEHQFNPDISVSVTNNGILPVWLRSSEFGTRTRSHVRYFVQRDCAGQELGDMRASISIESDNLKIASGRTTVVRFEAIDRYESASLYLQFKDWRGHKKTIKCGELNLDKMAIVDGD